jgi:linoleoyl-CoA desaturase
MNNKISFVSSAKADYHYRQLQKLVKERFALLPPQGGFVLQIRAVLLILLYFFLYTVALMNKSSLPALYGAYAVMGMIIVLVFLNVIHEAIHGNLFSNKTLNRLSVGMLDIMGANSYIFRKRHVNLHHNYPNVQGWDSDIEQAALIKIFPHGEGKNIHRLQHWTFSLLYPVYLVNWVFVRDFKDYFIKSQVVRKMCRKIPGLEYVKLFLFKSFFIFYMVGVPALLGINVFHAVAAMLCMLIVAGTFALIVLLTPHVNVKNGFPLPDKNNRIGGGWFLHQLSTTNDISSDNWITRNVMANFNYHLAHHLFPNVSYSRAPYITSIIKDYAAKHKLDYRAYSIAEALKYHYVLLRQNARLGEILEDDM